MAHSRSIRVKSVNPKSVGILGATFATPNLGVSALASGAIRCLHKRYPDAKLFFLDYEPEITKTVVEEDCELVVPMIQMRFSKRFWLKNNIVVLLLLAVFYRLLPIEFIRTLLKKRNRTFSAICDAELFTAVSGGDSFSDLYGLPRFLYVVLPQVLVLLLGKPLIQLPQTYGPFKGKIAGATARWIVTRSDRAFCRDFSSLNSMFSEKGQGSQPSNASFCYDMAFGIDSSAPAQLAIDGVDVEGREDGSLIGVNISGLLYREAGHKRSSFGIRANYRDTMLAVIDYFIREVDARVLLVPHVMGDEPGDESDLQVCREIYAELKDTYKGKIGVARGVYGPNEIRYIIGKCDFFTGSRMHACIAAWSQCIPAVAIAYSDKFLGVLNTIGVSSLAADARALTQQDLIDRLRAAFHARRETSTRLKAVIPDVRSTVHHMLFDTADESPNATQREKGSETVAAHAT